MLLFLLSKYNEIFFFFFWEYNWQEFAACFTSFFLVPLSSHSSAESMKDNYKLLGNILAGPGPKNLSPSKLKVYCKYLATQNTT